MGSLFFESFASQNRLNVAVFSVDSCRFCAYSSSLLIRTLTHFAVEVARRGVGADASARSASIMTPAEVLISR
jgi:hypothetical protein